MPKTIVERIAEVAATVPQIDKEGDNGTYTYLTAVDVFDTIRIGLFKAGILIIPVSHKVTVTQPYFNLTGDITDQAVVEVNYQITDGQKSQICSSVGIGQDHEGKAILIAMTSAEKALIKQLLLLAGKKDDPENFTDVGQIDPGLAAKIEEMEKKFGTDSREWTVDRQFVVAWCSACRTTGYKVSAQKAFLKKIFKIDKISDLKRKDTGLAMNWALGKMEMEASGEAEDDDGEDSSS